MNRPRPTIRCVALLGVAVLLVAGASGCNAQRPGSDPIAATVNGTDITREQVERLVEVQLAYADESVPLAKKAAKAKPSDTALASAVTQAVSNQEAVEASFAGIGPDTLGVAGAGEMLNMLIQTEVSRAALEAVDGKVDPAEAKELRASLESSLKAQGFSASDVKRFTPLIEASVELRAIQSALASHYRTPKVEAAYEAELRKVYEQQADAQAQLCLNVIAATDPAVVQTALDRVNAGEDFLTVGNEISEDKTTLTPESATCALRTNLVNVFGEAASTAGEGALLGPTGSDGTYALAKVASVKVPTFEESREAIAQNTTDPVDALVHEAIVRHLKKVEVSIDPRFGTWNPTVGLVVPPVDPLATTTTTTAALTAAPSGASTGSSSGAAAGN